MASERKHSKGTEDFKLKGIGPHWFLDIGGKLKLLAILDNAKNVCIENNVIFAGDELYQVLTSDDGEISVSKIEVVDTTTNTARKIKGISTLSDTDRSAKGESFGSAENAANNAGTSDKSSIVVSETEDVCRSSTSSDTVTSFGRSGTGKSVSSAENAVNTPNILNSSHEANLSEGSSLKEESIYSGILYVRRGGTSSSNGSEVEVKINTDDINISTNTDEVQGSTFVSALYDFEAFLDDEISFKKTDRFKLYRECNGSMREWCFAEHLRTGKKGYIPRACVINNMSSLEIQEWWFNVDRKAADNLLLSQNFLPGTFLVRPCNDKDSFALSVRDFDQKIKHHIIRRLENGEVFINQKKTFKNMLDLVFHYKNDADGLCCELKIPCPKVRPLDQFKGLEVSRDSVKCLRRLGSGYFGQMYAGKWRNTVDVLVKTLKQGKVTADDFLAEAEVMQHLQHNNLVQLKAVCTKSEPIFIITELLINGTLLIYLRKDKGKTLKFVDLTFMAGQIAEGMAYLEKKKCVHRDLRASNILVGVGNEVKIANFNLACFITGDIYKAPEKAAFAIKWTAPEAANDRKISIKSDVWSFGILLYELITFGRVPYPGMNGHEVLNRLDKGFRMPRPKDGPVPCPEPYYDTMLKCWKQVADNRPTFDYLQDFYYNYSVSTEKEYWPIVTKTDK